MRLNPHSPSDNPMEQLLYCFGGGGDSGGSDGTDDGDVGTAGSGGGVAPGGQASDSSGNFGGGDGGGGGFDPGFDEGDVGGVSVGGRAQAPGPSGGFGDSPGPAAAYGGYGSMPDVGRVSYPTVPDYGAKAVPGVTAVPGFAPQNFGRRSTVDVADLDAMAEIQDALAGSGRSDITSGDQTGTTDLSTMIDPSNQLDPFGDGFMSEEESAKNLDALQRSLALPTLDISRPSPKADITVSVPGPSTPGGVPGTRTEAFSPQAGIPGISQAQAAANAVSRGLTRDQEAALGLTPAITITGLLDDKGTGVPDPVGDSIDRAISDFAGFRTGRVQEMDDEGNVTTDEFSLTRDLVSKPPAYGAAYNPAEQLRMQLGPEGLYGIDFSAAGIPTEVDIFGVEVPTGLGVIEGIGNAIFNPAYATRQAVDRGYAIPIYSSDGTSIVGAATPDGRTVYDLDPYGNLMTELKSRFGQGPGIDQNLEDAYNRAQQLADEERERSAGRDGGFDIPPTTLPDPVTEECPAGYVRDGSGACVYEGKNVVRDAQYTPAGPRDFNYTGIPSLAPFTLRPSARPVAQPVDPFALLRSPRS